MFFFQIVVRFPWIHPYFEISNFYFGSSCSTLFNTLKSSKTSYLVDFILPFKMIKEKTSFLLFYSSFLAAS
jgi:hypothetical protein